MCHIYVGVCRGQETVWDLLEVELQSAVLEEQYEPLTTEPFPHSLYFIYLFL